MTRDYEQFPEDDNGNVLWQMAQDGDDLGEPHQVEFSIIFQDQAQLEQCALHLLHQEQQVSFFNDEDSDAQDWILTIHVEMIPDYSDIVDLEEWFTSIAEKFSGEYDGWGCMAYVYDDEDEEFDDELPED
ncbi:regulator of ribonuclease activity B [Acinetobacter calcoaceticus]|uniref:Regulator of ribonuclease activity B n=1 Tax=Acinetobacter calcoaceticus TaxID=471 RepID=A0A4R1XUB6_ACICA|nr:regulator of ribonuclease activity B [Acinetobacter calcoaceticus]